MIIYVYPDGQAHTKDQAHEAAILIDKWISGTLSERIRKAMKAVGEFAKVFADAMTRAFKALQPLVIYFEEIVEQMEPKNQPIHHYQRIYQAKHAGRQSRDQYYNKMKNASRSQRKPFKVFQRKI